MKDDKAEELLKDLRTLIVMLKGTEDHRSKPYWGGFYWSKSYQYSHR